MKTVYFLLLLVGAINVLGQRSTLPGVCSPEAPKFCEVLSDCPTCCCNSSANVEFYNSTSERECTAPPAVYEITFTYTWTETCQPDYYFENASWSRPMAFSHNSAYRMWDACMDDNSQGVDALSTTGDRKVLTLEGVQQAVGPGNVLDGPIFDGDNIPQGNGTTSIYLTLDRYHQYVSTLTKLIPSPDRVVGVADLRLCDGDEWKETVKVCMELFSTAAASERVADEMERNSVQGNNCSFGYVEFSLMKTQIFEKRTKLDEDCYPMVPERCPRSDPIEACPTCCCESSDNVEFYDPDASKPECTASPAVYDMTFNFAWSEVCQPDDYNSYLFFTPVWSSPIGVSHNTEYRMWDACMDDVSVGLGLVSQIGLTSVIIQEFMAAGDNILNYTVGVFSDPTSKQSQNLTVDKDHQWVSAVSNRGPTPDQIVGVADLCLCDGDKWRESVKICMELFSTGAASERVAGEMKRNSVQNKECNFGYIVFSLIEKRPETDSSGQSFKVAVGALSALVALAYMV